MRKKTTAEQYYNQLETFDRTGLILEGTMQNEHSRTIDYFEIGSNRFISETVYFNNPEENNVQIFPSYQYYENNIIGANKGSKIETYTNN